MPTTSAAVQFTSHNACVDTLACWHCCAVTKHCKVIHIDTVPLYVCIYMTCTLSYSILTDV